ncbi:hypothetical protein M9H77_35092 [Catharanthus roseus]|uniref:Uncharacterized protein n=1 Tax=Catharanthus roseus TaxID=4058 RepID=A0ACB9ZN13_CATRO|nr:hypothetical protein M9H77_35092 [Catharanthus roseus]
MREGGTGTREIDRWVHFFTESLAKKILIEKFLKSKELQELHKHHSGEKEGEYVDFTSEELWVCCDHGITVPDDLAIMAIVAGGMKYGRVYEVGSEVVHLKAESNWTVSYRGLAPIVSCCAGMLRMVESAILSVSNAFDENMRPFMEQNHFVYIPPLPMLDIFRAAMDTGASISLPPAPTADFEASVFDVAVRSSSIPFPSIRASDTDDAHIREDE